eukprot:1138778-Pelagomonas_calceolata.AAC.5
MDQRVRLLLSNMGRLIFCSAVCMRKDKHDKLICLYVQAHLPVYASSSACVCKKRQAKLPQMHAARLLSRRNAWAPSIELLLWYA